MRAVKKLLAISLLVPLVLLFLPLCVRAESVTEKLGEDFMELIPEEYGELTDSEAVTEVISIGNIINEIISAFTGEGGVISFFLLLMGLSLFGCLAAAMPSVSEIAESGASVISCGIIYEVIYPKIAYAAECLSEAVSFFGGVIPVMIGISSASGSTVTAAAQGATMSLMLSVVSGFCVKLILPLAVFGVALGAFCGVGDLDASNLSVGVRNLFLWLTGIGSAVITGAMSLQTVISSSADTAAIRAAKYSAANLIPIVGGTVSSALSTLSAGAAYLKSSVGATTVAVLMSVLISPLVTLLLYRGAISLVVTVSGFFGAGAVTRSLTAIRGALDSVCAVFSLCALIFIMQTVLFMKGGAQI